MSEPVRVIRWDDFRLLRPVPPDIGEFAAMLEARDLCFVFRDDPARYVRKMLDRLPNGDVTIDLGEAKPAGQLCRVDWHGFVDAVRKYLGDGEAARAVIGLTDLAGGPELNN